MPAAGSVTPGGVGSPIGRPEASWLYDGWAPGVPTGNCARYGSVGVCGPDGIIGGGVVACGIITGGDMPCRVDCGGCASMPGIPGIAGWGGIATVAWVADGGGVGGAIERGAGIGAPALAPTIACSTLGGEPPGGVRRDVRGLRSSLTAGAWMLAAS